MTRLEAFAAQLAKFQASGKPLSIVKSLGTPWSTTAKGRIIVLDSSFNPPTLAHMNMAVAALRKFSKSAGQLGNQPRVDHQTQPQEPNDADSITYVIGVLLLLSVNNADKMAQPAPFAQRLCMMQDFAEDLLDVTKSTSASSESVLDVAVSPSIAIGLTTLPFFHSKAEAFASLDSDSGGSDSTSDSFTTKESETRAEVEQVYLAGFDTLIRILNPKYYGGATGMRAALGPFFSRARLLITMRPDNEWGGVDEQRRYLEKMENGGLEEIGGCKGWLRRVELVEGRRPGEPVVSSTLVREAVRNGDETQLDTLVSRRVKNWIVSKSLFREI
ncbi:hypothetical protein BROUX41_005318 [Berkeleyomyces rouxiae]|uniref:uncharacterized protein n=1 Tax=Berkeleyomyces rouxiae TaxID=2035830 RepID=UPI003B7B4B82